MKLASYIFDFNSLSYLDNLKYIAWVINATIFLQFILYTLYIMIKNPSPESMFCPNKDTFYKFKPYIKLAFQSIIIFLGHFLGSEFLNVILARKYENDSKKYLFDIAKIVQSYAFILMKFTIGMSLGTVNVINILKSKQYYDLIKRFIRIMIYLSLLISFTILGLTLVFSGTLSNFYLNEDKFGYYDRVNFYIIVTSVINIFGIVESVMQFSLVGIGKQKIVSILCFCVLLPGEILMGVFFILFYNLELKGIYLTHFIIEVSLFIAFGLILYFHKIDVNDEKDEEELNRSINR